MDDALLPCPFCRSTNLSAHQVIWWRVLCLSCWGRGPGLDTEAEAIAAWNAAPRPAAPSDPYITTGDHLAAAFDKIAALEREVSHLKRLAASWVHWSQTSFMVVGDLRVATIREYPRKTGGTYWRIEWHGGSYPTREAAMTAAEKKCGVWRD